MNDDGPRFEQLRRDLDDVLDTGLAKDPLAHAQQVAQIAGTLHAAFELVGLRATLVGGSAIEVHAPGVYKSDDIDLVISGPAKDFRGEIGRVFHALGFVSTGRHWTRGDLFVEVPGRVLDDPHETVRVGTAVFEIVTKEVVLADRIIGFKHWRYTGYGQQAIDMLAAFGGELDLGWLGPRLKREDSWDAYLALQELAAGQVDITEQSLQALLDRLHRRSVS